MCHRLLDFVFPSRKRRQPPPPPLLTIKQRRGYDVSCVHLRGWTDQASIPLSFSSHTKALRITRYPACGLRLTWIDEGIIVAIDEFKESTEALRVLRQGSHVRISLYSSTGQVTLVHVDEIISSSDNDGMCVVCWEHDPCVMFNPCHHMVTCQTCAHELRKCPLCRETIQGRIHVYT